MANRTGRKAAPYKDFLSPTLHKRFMSTITFLVALAYVEALVLADWSSLLWAWFPFGPALFRTLLLSAAGLVTLLVRVEYYHVGIRTSNSVFHNILHSIVRTQTYWTFLWFIVSSAVFCIPLLSSYSADTDFHWIVYKNGDRARLNEKPLFLTTYLLGCAVIQAMGHVFGDRDRLLLREPPKAFDSNGQEIPLGPLGRVTEQLTGVFISSTVWAALTLVFHMFAYFLILRPLAWGWALFFLRPFYNLPKTNMLPPSGPVTFYSLKTCLVSGCLVFVLWKASSVAFSIFMARKPLKSGKPLTAESKDPNGSLLNGLKSKKQYIRTFAMWELAYISRDFEDRRKAIFEDIDRKDGPVWSQIYTTCIDLVKALTARVDEYGKQPAPPPAEATKSEPLKARSSAPPKEDVIFKRQPASKSMRAEVDKVFDRVARSPGETPMSGLSPVAKKTWKMAKDSVLTPEQQDALETGNMLGQFKQLFSRLLLNDYAGMLFRQEYRQRLAAAVLGTPSAEPGLYLNAIEVLGMLAEKSLAEDKYGNVHRDVPTIIRTFTNTVTKLEAFKATFPVHWTDVDATKESPEVDALLQGMKESLRQLVYEFEPYRNDLRLTLTDIRLAKEAAGEAEDEPEMTQARR